MLCESLSQHRGSAAKSALNDAWSAAIFVEEVAELPNLLGLYRYVQSKRPIDLKAYRVHGFLVHLFNNRFRIGPVCTASLFY